MKKVLITGGAGFIGSYLARELINHGAEVVIYDAFINYCSPFESHYQLFLKRRFEGILDRVSVERGDTRDQSRTIRTLMHHKPDVVVHLAALSDARQCRLFPEEANSTNVDGTLRVLEAVRHVDTVKRFCFVSSSFVYGHFQYRPADEKHPVNPIDVYGGSKLSGETLTKSYCKESGIAYTIIRPSSVYGFGDANMRVSHILVENALSGKPLTLHGGGENVLDFSYVKDVAKGMFLAVSRPEGANEVFNITRGEARKVSEFAEIVRKYVPGAEMVSRPADFNRPKRGALDISKARKLLGYEPRYGIEEGIREYIDDFKERGPDL